MQGNFITLKKYELFIIINQEVCKKDLSLINMICLYQTNNEDIRSVFINQKKYTHLQDLMKLTRFEQEWIQQYNLPIS